MIELRPVPMTQAEWEELLSRQRERSAPQTRQYAFAKPGTGKRRDQFQRVVKCATQNLRLSVDT